MLETLREKLIAEFDYVSKKMDALDVLCNDSLLDKWSNLSHYKNGIRFCLDEIEKIKAENLVAL